MVMLHKKMLRDLMKNKTAYLACCAIIAIGLMCYVSMENVNNTLNSAMKQFYNAYRFADGFIYVNSMPSNQLSLIRDIEGMDEVSGKLVKDVRLLCPDREENIYIRLVSVDLKEENRLNDIWLKEGFPLEEGKRNIWTGIKFFEENNLSYGDELNVIINGRLVGLNVIGKAQSPEHVYVSKTAADFMPSDRDFGVAYIPCDVMETLFESKGMINEIGFTMDPDHSFEDIKNSIESRLKKYQTQVVERKDQVSHFMLAEELEQLEKMSASVPILFLMISSIILWIMLKRLVEQQRMQIGTLKACGYSSYRILCHYVSYTIVIGIVGGTLGGVFGFMVSDMMMEMYNEFFTLPGLQSEFSIRHFIIGVVLSVLLCSLAGVFGAKSVLSLEPAESMRPPSPVSGKKVLLEKSRLFWNALTVQGKMAVRNIFRSKGRSAFTFMGVAFSFSLMASLFSFVDMFDVMILDTFKYVQKYDAKVTLLTPQNASSLVGEFRRMADVEQVEPMWEVPVTLKKAHRKSDTVVLGLIPDSELYHVVDRKNQRVNVQSGGILLAEPLAKKLNVKTGDILEVETPFSQKDDLQIRVSAIVPQYIGTNGYMLLEELNEWLGHPEAANVILLQLPNSVLIQVKNSLNTSEKVSGIEEKNQIRDKYMGFMDQAFFMLYSMAAMAILTGFAIIYNSGLVSLSERERELASLRVLGMSNREVMEILTFEQVFLSVFGVLTGVPLTYLFNQTLSSSFETDLYNLPVIVEPKVFVYALIGTFLALLLAYLSINKRVRKLDMVEVLKERE